MARECITRSGRRIIITSPDEVALRGVEMSPVACCLLTAWTDDHASALRTRALQVAFESDCRYFICAGRRAKQLHDALDESIESVVLETGSLIDAELLPTTAWFEGGPGEIADVFLQSGDPRVTTRQDAIWLAVLDDACSEDTPIIVALLALANEVP
jgi:hypothetical protein